MNIVYEYWLYYIFIVSDKLKKFHGNLFSEGPWNSRNFDCCSLCKTKNKEGKKRHWAGGLCRSCYRRLSITHRLYNDNWGQKNSKNVEFTEAEAKKDYKDIDPSSLKFCPTDISSLLERYDYKCAYCKIDLQDFDHLNLNAFQCEYRVLEDKNIELVPICKSCNCSKKNTSEDFKLRRWAQERKIEFPFKYKSPK